MHYTKNKAKLQSTASTQIGKPSHACKNDTHAAASHNNILVHALLMTAVEWTNSTALKVQ